jgi:lipopolysaccharide export system permease protein
MNRFDRLILKRLGGRVLVTLLLVFGLIAIVESTNWPLYLKLAEVGGELHAVLGLVATSGRWLIRTLAMTVLIGTTLGILSLQTHHELNIMKASGVSIWRMMNAPQIQRAIMPSQNVASGSFAPDGTFWLEQSTGSYRYVLSAGSVQASNLVLDGATFFLVGQAAEYDRIIAPEARYTTGAWRIPEGVGFMAGQPPRRITEYEVPTTSTFADIRFRMSPSQDLTFLELAAMIRSGLSDPAVARAAITRLLRYLALPLLLAGSVLLAFAFATQHRRVTKYGAALSNSVVGGFVLFFIAEVADQAGTAGTVEPILAATAPPLAAAVIGLTALLFREDGWT